MRLLKLEERPQNFQPWLELIQRIHHPAGEARIAIVGKYVQLEDAYKSLREALLHGGLAHNHKTVIDWIESEEIDSLQTAADRLRGYDGILVPGGFGKRGIEGMVHTIQYARENKIPFFGICLGMQCATIEYARDVAGLKQANSTEFDPQTPYRVIYKLRELLGIDEMGGTMRLGAWDCKLEPGSFAHKAYGKLDISERHRHRYEFNREHEKALVAAGLKITGRTPDENYVEIVEAPEHPWFLGCQFHPEFKSKPLEPHPLFAAFIGAALRHKKERSKPANAGASTPTSRDQHTPIKESSRTPVSLRASSSAND
jgi:CTP synthase